MGGKASRGDQEEMNKEISLRMAGYLEGDRLIQQFKMSNPETCTIGHALRVIENRSGRFNYRWFSGATERIFGIPRASRESFFCFGGRFSDNPKAAAFRLRYVAQHDAAPSDDQWDNFNSVPGVVEAEDEEASDVVLCQK